MPAIFLAAMGNSWAEDKSLDAIGAESLHNANAKLRLRPDQRASKATLAREAKSNPTRGQQIQGPTENEVPVRCMGYGDLQSISLTDWEAGLGSWTAGTHDIANPDTFDTPDWATVGALPDARAGMAAFVANLSVQDCETDDETGALTLDSPPILIPDGTEVPRISVDHWFDVEFRFDGGNFKISVNDGPFNLIPASAIEVRPYIATLYSPLDDQGDELNTNPLADEDAFTGPDAGGTSGSWGQSHINLLGIASAGDTIRLRFDFGVDVCFGVTGWYVDEVEFYSCSAELPPSDCGNGVMDEGEQCDDGNDFIEDGCSNTCQIEDGWQCTVAIPPGEVSDPSFEDGTPNPSWAESSTNFGTPICDVDTCDTGEGTGPLDGNFWAWFGGIEVQEEASLSQSVIIPSTATELTFGLEVSACDSPADYLEVLIDGTRELLIDGSSPLCGFIGYSTQMVDISAYADGGAHDLEFHAETFGNNLDATNIFIDVIDIPGAVSVCTPGDATTLVLVKEVTNDDGGDAQASAWTLAATGPSSFSGNGPNVTSPGNFLPGSYNLSESGGPEGYTSGAWECVGGTQDDADSITLGSGETATCTITNDDEAPSLTLVKEVTNNDGGTELPSAWTLTATGPASFSGSGPSVSSGLGFKAGSYDLSESGPGGYSASVWVCSGGTQNDADTITLGPGETASCTITNDDIPDDGSIFANGFESN